MTTVLHTADVHLAADEPERWEALRTLLGTAADEAIDVVTIGGDLFDDPGTLEEFRPRLRNDLFADRPFEILLIPGNHDIEAYRGDVFFGDACSVLTEEPFDHWTAPDGDLRITALPYRDQPDDELLIALQNRAPFDGVEALLFHGSLDAPFDEHETGEEGTRRYFPVTEEVLTELGFDYYLAGHYHSPHKVPLADGAEFAYPGTPASTRRSETGQRRVSILDPADGITLEALDSFHYVSREDTVVPGDEEELLDDIRDWADQQLVESALGSIHVDGLIEMDEQQFHEELTSAADPASVTDETRAVDHVLAHPLFAEFREELAQMEWDDAEAEAVTRRTLDVFSHLSVEGEV